MSGSELKGGGAHPGVLCGRKLPDERTRPGRRRVYGDRRAGTGEATLILCQKLTQRATGSLAGGLNAAPEIYSTFSGYAGALSNFDFAIFQAFSGRLIVLLFRGPGGRVARAVAGGGEPAR